MVGGDAVAQFSQDAGAGDVADRGGVHGYAVEIGRVLDVGGAVRPAVGGVVAVDLNRLPLLRALEDFTVALEELVAGQADGDDVGNFLVGGPDVLQVDGLAVGAGAEWFGGDVDR